MVCTINNCANFRGRFGAVCYEHFLDKRKYGTYNPTVFKFFDDVSKPTRLLYKDNFTTPSIEALALRIDKLYKNPYSHTIEILKGSHKGSLCSSKEKIANYIKKNKAPTVDSHHIAIRLGYVFKLYQDGEIEAGGQLRFNLAKALLPYVSSSGQGLQIKEVIGNIALKNYIKDMMVIADELNSKYL